MSQEIQKIDMDVELRNRFLMLGNTIRKKFKVDRSLKIDEMANEIRKDNLKKYYNGYTVDENGTLTRQATYPDIRLNNIVEIGERGLQYQYYRCTNIRSAEFQNLSSIGEHRMSNCFQSCSNLSSVSFQSLTSIGQSGMYYCFYSCSNLSSVSFPSLTSIGSYGMADCFQSCSNLKEIHFKASSRSVVEATFGYSTKWGATNATVYFDL